LAVTNRRLIVFGHSTGLIKINIDEVLAAIDRVRLVDWSYKSGKIVSVLNLAFSDESSAGIEMGRANKPDAFAAALITADPSGGVALSGSNGGCRIPQR